MDWGFFCLILTWSGSGELAILTWSGSGELAVWVGGLDSWDPPHERHCYLGGTPRIANLNPNHQFTICWHGIHRNDNHQSPVIQGVTLFIPQLEVTVPTFELNEIQRDWKCMSCWWGDFSVFPGVVSNEIQWVSDGGVSPIIKLRMIGNFRNHGGKILAKSSQLAIAEHTKNVPLRKSLSFELFLTCFDHIPEHASKIVWILENRDVVLRCFTVQESQFLRNYVVFSEQKQ